MKPFKIRKARALMLRTRFKAACEAQGILFGREDLPWSLFAELTPAEKREMEERREGRKPGVMPGRLKEHEVISSWCEQCDYFSPEHVQTSEKETPCTLNHVPKYWHPATEKDRVAGRYGYKRRCLDYYPAELAAIEDLQKTVVAAEERLVRRRKGREQKKELQPPPEDDHLPSKR
jgi:hypothetical protein